MYPCKKVRPFFLESGGDLTREAESGSAREGDER